MTSGKNLRHISTVCRDSTGLIRVHHLRSWNLGDNIFITSWEIWIL